MIPPWGVVSLTLNASYAFTNTIRNEIVNRNVYPTTRWHNAVVWNFIWHVCRPLLIHFDVSLPIKTVKFDHFQEQMVLKFVDQPNLNAVTMRMVLLFGTNSWKRVIVCHRVCHLRTVHHHHNLIMILSVPFRYRALMKTNPLKSTVLNTRAQNHFNLNTWLYFQCNIWCSHCELPTWIFHCNHSNWVIQQYRLSSQCWWSVWIVYGSIAFEYHWNHLLFHHSSFLHISQWSSN